MADGTKRTAKANVPQTLGDHLCWAYANLGMAHMARTRGDARYGRLHYAVRSRLYSGLRTGSMTVGTLLDDERLKMILPAHCAYCGSTGPLSIDHVLPRARGGADESDNVVWACRSCNSSKGPKDLLAWYADRGQRPPLLLVRRYLKLCIGHVREGDLWDAPIADLPDLPFTAADIPTSFPDPLTWPLWVVELP